MASIGFIGLGHMGLPMARRLLMAGHDVLGFDLNQQALCAWQAVGGQRAADLKDLAENSELIIMMLPTGEQVSAVCQGPGGILCHAPFETVIINCGTIGIEAVSLLSQSVKQFHQFFLDAPVSGGVSAAEAGTLTFMVGGEASILAKVSALLYTMGRLVIHTGNEQSAQTAKLCNNLILGASMLAVSEAFVLAKALGLSPEKLYEVVCQSSGRCWAMTDYPPIPGLKEQSPANHEYQPGFSALMMLKDLRLAQEAGQHAELKLSLAEHVTMMYTEASKKIAALDFSAVITCISK